MNRLGLAGKMLLAICLPLLALLFFASHYAYDRYRVTHEMAQALQQLTVVERSAQLVHELQKERGMSAGFIGSEGRKFADALPRQRQQVDEAISRFQGLERGSVHEQADLGLSELTGIRDQVDKLAIEAPRQVAFYSQLIASLLKVVDEISLRSQDAAIALQTNAYAAFLQNKERMGMERATLSNVFAKGSFTPATLQQFMSLLSAQQSYLERFRAAASPAQQRLLEEIEKSPVIAEVAKYEQLALDKMTEGGLWCRSGAMVCREHREDRPAQTG